MVLFKKANRYIAPSVVKTRVVNITVTAALTSLQACIFLQPHALLRKAEVCPSKKASKALPPCIVAKRFLKIRVSPADVI